MPTLPQLADAVNYRACETDLTQHDAQRAYWLNLFRSHFPSLLDHAVAESADRGGDADAARTAAAAAQDAFFAYLDRIATHPESFDRIDIISICIERERVLRQARFDDPFRLAKERENAMALKALPHVLKELDSLEGEALVTRAILGVFAGNIFDLGASETAALFAEGSVDFHQTRAKLRPRPWLIDHIDALLAAFTEHQQSGRWKRALLFVDNAGSDIVLGMIPLARTLLKQGISVILAANTSPSLNDITAAELRGLMDQVAALDPTLAAALRDGSLQIAATGNGLPLIDLTQLDADFVALAASDPPIDLVVLEGMGRGVESNLSARFTCDAVKIAMIKDRGVAEHLGGSVYDLVLRYDPAPR